MFRSLSTPKGTPTRHTVAKKVKMSDISGALVDQTPFAGTVRISAWALITIGLVSFLFGVVNVEVPAETFQLPKEPSSNPYENSLVSALLNGSEV